MGDLSDAFRDDRAPEQIERANKRYMSWPKFKCKTCKSTLRSNPKRPRCGVCGGTRLVQVEEPK